MRRDKPSARSTARGPILTLLKLRRPAALAVVVEEAEEAAVLASAAGLNSVTLFRA
jgi:hypothetical protein